MKKSYNVIVYKQSCEIMHESELKDLLQHYGVINLMTDAGHYMTIDGEIIHIIEMKGANKNVE